MFLSKTDFMLAEDCVKALWLKKNRKDLDEEIDTEQQKIMSTGNQVQELARAYFPNGVMVPADNWDVINGSEITKELAQKHDVLYEAFARMDNGAFCRIDILKRNKKAWDLIEIKATNRVKEEHFPDLAFQKYVFENAGYPVKECYVLHLNKDYKKHGKINVKKLFKLEKVSEDVKEYEINTPVKVEQYMKFQQQKSELSVLLHKGCLDCKYFYYCGKNLPSYSIFNLLNKREADVFYAETGKFEIKDLPASVCKNKFQLIEREAFLTGQVHVEKEEIKKWLKKLKYPLYYLDYETVMEAIPRFDDAWPYEQVPFQFSLHIQQKKDGPVKHVSFLHKEKSDPRRALAEFLVKNCGDKGSVIVYFEDFEKTRNKELADLFPDLHDQIIAINDRVVDLLEPFDYRYLYSPKQVSSASIKKVLPAFTDLSYQNLGIHDGSEAAARYELFLNGKLSKKEEQTLFDDLEKYCGQDTYAMVLLINILYKYIS